MGKIVIVGVGNLLMADEGIGVHVINELMKGDLPENVELVDGGTSTLDLLPFIEKADRLIVVDAVIGGQAPGTIYKLSPDDFRLSDALITSLHQLNFLHMLSSAEMRGNKPRTTIIGVEPKDVTPKLELSHELQQKVPEVIKLLMEEVDKCTKSAS